MHTTKLPIGYASYIDQVAQTHSLIDNEFLFGNCVQRKQASASESACTAHAVILSRSSPVDKVEDKEKDKENLPVEFNELTADKYKGVKKKKLSGEKKPAAAQQVEEKKRCQSIALNRQLVVVILKMMTYREEISIRSSMCMHACGR